VIAVVFIIASSASIAARISVAKDVRGLGDRLIPIQDKVSELSRAYVNQETGQRGFLLTGNPVTLEPYTNGLAITAKLADELRKDLADFPVAKDLLEQELAAADAWRTQAAEPQIKAQQAGHLEPEEIRSMVLAGKMLFDELRDRYRALSANIKSMVDAQLHRIGSAQHLANYVQFGAATVLALAIIGAVVVVQFFLSRPVKTLVEEVRAVADGDYDQPFQRGGPREIAELSEAVEEMRDSLRTATGRLVDVELREEQARIAADLHDRVIQRVFGLGLGLTSAAARGNRDLAPFIDETDGIIRDLRESIFNLNHSVSSPGRAVRLRSAIIDLLDARVSPLPFTPTLRFDGPIDEATISPTLQASILAVLRESLSNVARHAHATAATVSVVVGKRYIRITVEDNGIGISETDTFGHGRRNVYARAKQFGGSAEIRNASPGPGTVVDWLVPLTPLEDQPADRQPVGESS
jgi:signal transduction histidine kinase